MWNTIFCWQLAFPRKGLPVLLDLFQWLCKKQLRRLAHLVKPSVKAKAGIIAVCIGIIVLRGDIPPGLTATGSSFQKFIQVTSIRWLSGKYTIALITWTLKTIEELVQLPAKSTWQCGNMWSLWKTQLSVWTAMQLGNIYSDPASSAPSSGARCAATPPSYPAMARECRRNDLLRKAIWQYVWLWIGIWWWIFSKPKCSCKLLRFPFVPYRSRSTNLLAKEW